MYTVIHHFLRWLFATYFVWESEGAHHIPTSGSAIIVSNHVNYLDPLAIGAVAPRLPHFMAKEELFSHPAAGWLLRKLGAFPVRRGKADRRAIRRALQILDEGNVLAMFPEGTRSPTGQLMELQRGAALLALKSGAPVVPVVIEGAYEALQNRRVPRRGVSVSVRVGPPLHPETAGRVNQEGVTAFSQRIHQALEALYRDGS